MNNLLKNIKFEKDYTKFHFLQSNRIVDPRHTTKMSNSLKSMEAVRPVVCINTNVVDGKKKLYIIDGQHLFYSLMKEEAEVPYVILEIKDMKDMIYKMALLNNSSKSWGLLDYIVAYKAVDIDYQFLFELNLKYSIELNMITAICLNTNSASLVGSIIKDGTFKNHNKNSIEMCDKFQEIFVNIGVADRWVKHSFFIAFMMNYNKYKHSETIENISKNISTVKMMTANDNVKNFINNLFIK
jgi:hypothetical protein